MSVLIDGLPSMPKTLSFSIRVHMSISLRLFILKPDGLSDHALVIYIVENLKYIAVMH